MEIQLSGMCGNSPKNKLAEDLAVALITGDTKTTISLLRPKALRWLPPAVTGSSCPKVYAQRKAARFAIANSGRLFPLCFIPLVILPRA